LADPDGLELKLDDIKNNEDNDNDNDRPSVICFYSAPTQAQRANAIFLICAWQVLHLNRAPAQAFYGFSFAKDDNHHDNDNDHGNHHDNQDHASSIPPHVPLTSIGKATLQPLLPFHDASPCACTYELNLMHCLQGLQKAKRFNFFNWDTFNVDEYEHFEQVEVCILYLVSCVMNTNRSRNTSSSFHAYANANANAYSYSLSPPFSSCYSYSYYL
jgi:hypothetical protein